MTTFVSKMVHRASKVVSKRLVKPSVLGFQIATTSNYRVRERIARMIRDEDKLTKSIKAASINIPLINSMSDFECVCMIELMEGENMCVATKALTNVTGSMALCRRIVHYGSSTAADIEWNKISMDSLPSADGGERALLLAGIRTNVRILIKSTARQAADEREYICVVSDADVEALSHALNVLNSVGPKFSFGRVSARALLGNEIIVKSDSVLLSRCAIHADVHARRVAENEYVIFFVVNRSVENFN